MDIIGGINSFYSSNHNSHESFTAYVNTENNPTVNTDNSTNTSTDTGKKENQTKQNDSHELVKQQLNEEELKQVQELKKRDQEVRTHEAAHLAAAGQYATGGASYTYHRGPDGKNYAVAGEVGIDTSAIANDPAATIQKARQIRAAANAPAHPSSQDRQVASQAASLEAQARAELAEKQQENKNANEKITSTEKKHENDDFPLNSQAKNANKQYDAISNTDKPDSPQIIDLIA